jgi:hypothetical protein
MNCSFGLKLVGGELKEIPPGRTELDCHLKTYSPGEFQGQIHIFVDDGGTREIVLFIRGTTVPGESPTKKGMDE